MPPIRQLYILAIFLTVSCSALAQESLLQQAAELDSAHKCAEAERLYLSAVGSGPPPQALLNNLGNHYLTCDDPQKAAATFGRLLRINPAHVNGNLQMARLAVARKDGAGALSYLAHIAALKDPEIALVRAEALHQTGKTEAAGAAIAELLRNAGTGEQAAPLLFAIGVACGRMGFYDRAESAFGALLPLAPGDFEVIFNFGVAAARAGHYDRAKRALESAGKLRPDDVDTLYELGRVEQQLHSYDRAVYLLAQARKASPQRADIVLALARATQMAGFYGDALPAYDAYLALRPAGDPSDDLVRRDRALLRGYNRDTREEGLRDLTAYVRNHPADAIGFYDLAQILEQTDRARALDCVSTAVRLSPDFEPARFFRAWLLSKLDRHEEAIPEIRAALHLNPADVRALDLMGLDLLNLDKPSEAEKILRKASTLAPDNPDVLFHLARALIELDRREEAKPFLDRFTSLKRIGTRGPREGPGVIEAIDLTPEERRKRGIEQLRRSVASDPADLSLRADLGAALLDANETKEGTAVFAELLARNPPAGLLHRAGTTLLGFELYPMARDFLERAVRDKPDAAVDLAIALFYAAGPAQALSALDGIHGCAQDADCLLMKARVQEAAGQTEAAAASVAASLQYSISRPRLAEDTAVELLRHGKGKLVLDLTANGLRTSRDDAGLSLVRVAAMASVGRDKDAEQAAHDLEKRWPEWDRAYLMEGLVLERQSRLADAKQKIGIALALGSDDPAARCAQARLTGDGESGGKCSCHPGVFEIFFPACVSRK